MSGLFESVAAWGSAPWIALVIIGYALVVVEMYIPGFGLPGISGLFCLVVGIFFLSGGNVLTGLLVTLIVVALLCVALSISIRSAARGRLAKSRFVLKETSTSPDEQDNALSYYVGKTGLAKTILRPAGVAEFEGVRLNVLTDGDFIDENTKIVVERVEGNRIFVRKA
ncbi:MAG: hypothetical protein IJ048_10005 [Clostridia bacterium]|nr:hypothetical protein [Clostridia bacterium]